MSDPTKQHGLPAEQPSWDDVHLKAYLRDAVVEAGAIGLAVKAAEAWGGGGKWGRVHPLGLYVRPGGIAVRYAWFSQYLLARFGERVPWLWRANPRGSKHASKALVRCGAVERPKNIRVSQGGVGDPATIYAMVCTSSFYLEVLEAASDLGQIPEGYDHTLFDPESFVRHQCLPATGSCAACGRETCASCVAILDAGLCRKCGPVPVGTEAPDEAGSTSEDDEDVGDSTNHDEGENEVSEVPL